MGYADLFNFGGWNPNQYGMADITPLMPAGGIGPLGGLGQFGEGIQGLGGAMQRQFQAQPGEASSAMKKQKDAAEQSQQSAQEPKKRGILSGIDDYLARLNTPNSSGWTGMDTLSLGMSLLGNAEGGSWSGVGRDLATISQGAQARQAQAEEQRKQAALEARQKELIAQTGMPDKDRAIFELTGNIPKITDRKIVQGADGYQYYADTGERVLPNVQKTADRPKLGEGMWLNPETGKAEFVPGYLEGQKELAATGANRGSNVQSTFVDQEGQLVIVNRDGSLRPTGQYTQNPFQFANIGNTPYAFDRRTGGTMQLQTPEAVGTSEATIETVKANEEDRRLAQQGLPQARESASQMISAVDALVSHPGFAGRYGMTSIVPPIPGSEGAGAQAYINQVAGQAFLQAFQSLKGAGAITEQEGSKAAAAITRLGNQRISPEEARVAAEELKGIIMRGLQKQEALASGAYAPQSQKAGNLGYNAQTGTFSAPSVGDEVDGYVYRGGDPNKPGSWREK